MSSDQERLDYLRPAPGETDGSEHRAARMTAQEYLQSERAQSAYLDPTRKGRTHE